MAMQDLTREGRRSERVRGEAGGEGVFRTASLNSLGGIDKLTH